MKWDFSPIGLKVTTPLPFDLHLWLGQLTWAQLLACTTAPICLLKNVINFVQLWKASKILVGVDLAERAIEREKTKR
jgi:CDP-diacylglycerol--inositol 3-phosphatidyltransferase